MRHGLANKKLNRTSEHRKALLKNMLNSLIKYEQIKTTLPKAKFLKPQADKIITLGKKETLQTTKMLVSKLQDIKSANKVKKTLSKRYQNRKGGYTRIIKAGFRYGDNAPINTIFTARENTNKRAEIQINPNDTEDDFVTSRILWLDGLENGINRGVGVDSYSRYIYIHGTHEEGLIGQKASHGCIRMFNNDVIELFDMVSEGTKVQIRA